MPLMDQAAQAAPQPPMPPEVDPAAAETGAPADPAAEGQGEPFVKQDIMSKIPPDQKDAVQRIVAAGMKLMYSPETQPQLQKAVQAPGPAPKKMAENAVGILLTLDQQAKPSGLPPAAIFPAGYELCAECGQVLIHAGQNVTQDEFNAALQMMHVLISKKMKATDEQIMGSVQNPGQAPAEDSAPPEQVQQTQPPQQPQQVMP